MLIGTEKSLNAAAIVIGEVNVGRQADYKAYKEVGRAIQLGVW